MKKILLIIAMLVAVVGLNSAPAFAGGHDHGEHKSYVCKYVGKPGVDERLQTGQNPIWVDNHSLTGSPDWTYVGETFADAQGKSVVIVANTAKLNPEPDISQCPAPIPAKDATAAVNVTEPTCQSAGIASYTAEHATIDAPLDQTVGSHTASFTADAGHAFADGSSADSENYTIEAQLDADSEQCANADATASVDVTKPTCDAAGVASVTNLLHASLVGTLDESVGTHTATFAADQGYRFADGSKTKNVEYTISGPDKSLCPVVIPKDATAAVNVTTATCDAPGVASVVGLENASLVGSLDETPGDHVANFVAKDGHEFANGSTSLSVDYTIEAQLTGDQCQPPVVVPHDASASVGVVGPACDANGFATYSVENASLADLQLDETVGSHVAHFVADAGHLFSDDQIGRSDDGTSADVPYTVSASNSADCPNPPKHHNPPKGTPHHPSHPATPTQTLTSLPNAGMDNASANWERSVGFFLLGLALAGIVAGLWKRRRA